jgi:hypothetical protein
MKYIEPKRVVILCERIRRPDSRRDPRLIVVARAAAGLRRVYERRISAVFSAFRLQLVSRGEWRVGGREGGETAGYGRCVMVNTGFFFVVPSAAASAS